MTARDRKALAIAGVAAVLFVFLQFVLLPLWDESRRLAAGIATQKAQLAELRQLAQNHAARSGEALAQRVARRDPNFSLFAFLEEAAETSRVKPHVRTMQPVRLTRDWRDAEQEETGRERLAAVDLQLRAVGLRQLAQFLNLVDSPAHFVAVERIAIQGDREGSPLDVSLRVRGLEVAAPEAKP